MSDFFNGLVRAFRRLGDPDVIHRFLVLGDRDGVTGWRQKTWSEAPIKMVIIPQGATDLMKQAGTYVRLDAVGVTDSEPEEGDEIRDSKGTYWEVKTAKVHEYGSITNCDLVKLSLHEV